MSTATDIIESARIYGLGPSDRDADGDLPSEVTVEIDYVGCYGALALSTRSRIETAIAKKLGLVGWGALGGESSETGEVWTYRRPAHRPRQGREARITKSYRVDPATADAIEREAKRSGESQGQVLDRLARTL